MLDLVFIKVMAPPVCPGKTAAFKQIWILPPIVGPAILKGIS